MRRLNKLLSLSLFTAVSLIIYILELQIPVFISIPGVKLGLSNIITLMILLLFSYREALVVLLLRCCLGSILAGQLGALPYSLIGGLLALTGMALLKPKMQSTQTFVLSILGAILHNLGQILAAIFITETTKIVYYLPILVISGILTGLFTGLCVQYTFPHLEQYIKKTYGRKS